MSDADSHSLQHRSLIKMQSGRLYLSQVQNYSDFSIVPALVLCAHTVYGMQAYTPLTEKMQFPHHQEQNYVKYITDIGMWGWCTQISSKN